MRLALARAYAAHTARCSVTLPARPAALLQQVRLLSAVRGGSKAQDDAAPAPGGRASSRRRASPAPSRAVTEIASTEENSQVQAASMPEEPLDTRSVLDFLGISEEEVKKILEQGGNEGEGTAALEGSAAATADGDDDATCSISVQELLEAARMAHPPGTFAAFLGQEWAARLAKQGIFVLTEAQKLAFPVVMDGRHTVIKAETGSGKTLCYLVPMLQRLQQKAELYADAAAAGEVKMSPLQASQDMPMMYACALVVVPTQELVHQVLETAKALLPEYAHLMRAVYADKGVSRRTPCGFMVATPLALQENVNFKHLSELELVALDELDMLLARNHMPAVQGHLLSMLQQRAPEQRPQQIFVAATIPNRGKSSAQAFLDKYYPEPEVVRVETGGAHRAVAAVSHAFLQLDADMPLTRTEMETVQRQRQRLAQRATKLQAQLQQEMTAAAGGAAGAGADGKSGQGAGSGKGSGKSKARGSVSTGKAEAGTATELTLDADDSGTDDYDEADLGSNEDHEGHFDDDDYDDDDGEESGAGAGAGGSASGDALRQRMLSRAEEDHGTELKAEAAEHAAALAAKRQTAVLQALMRVQLSPEEAAAAAAAVADAAAAGASGDSAATRAASTKAAALMDVLKEEPKPDPETLLSSNGSSRRSRRSQSLLALTTPAAAEVSPKIFAAAEAERAAAAAAAAPTGGRARAAARRQALREAAEAAAAEAAAAEEAARKHAEAEAAAHVAAAAGRLPPVDNSKLAVQPAPSGAALLPSVSMGRLTPEEASRIAPAVVFANSWQAAEQLRKFLAAACPGIEVSALHKKVDDEARAERLARFKSGAIRVMVCTDLASRGVDTVHVKHVVQAEFPNDVVSFLHRVGRTGRAGRSGTVTSLLTRANLDLAHAVAAAIASGGSVDTAFSRRRSFLRRARRAAGQQLEDAVFTSVLQSQEGQ